MTGYFDSLVINDIAIDASGELIVFYWESCEGPIFSPGAMRSALANNWRGTNAMSYDAALAEWNQLAIY